MTEAERVSTGSEGSQPPREVAVGGTYDLAPAEIYKQIPSLPEPKPKTFLEFWGVKFMLLLLVAIVAITGLLGIAWFCTRPSMSDLTAIIGRADPNDAASATPRIDALQKICRNHLDSYRDLFQLLILGGLVPLFTLIAGYVFGRTQAEQKQQEEG